ncbi:MAG: hypothetical protein GY747_11565 [Planctomycetes bacterium]|nr:hypothetical protein [Planctomycetota bacterium]MCP4772268.1 hypothetical protein [Planctomycetota bacterium]MCP4861324.1 hypothetical protein [Planctomycetota bacterium]
MLVLGADAEDNLADVEQKLEATQHFAAVDKFNAFTGIPEAQFLERYHGVLLWSNYPLHDAYEYGNLLADYVDSGGGVVIAALATGQASGFTNTWLTGRWLTSSYQVLIPDGDFLYGGATMGSQFDPQHPTLQGVNDFHGGTASARSMNATLSPGSYRVANWSDGSVLVAENMQMRTPRIDLNFMPPSNDVYPEMWRANTDGALLMANALSRVSGQGRALLSSTAANAGGLLELHFAYLLKQSRLNLILSLSGNGPTQTPFGPCQVSTPWMITPTFTHGDSSDFDLSLTLPPSLAGHTIYCQALERSEGGVSGWSTPLAVVVS